jgi:hypothetical protein
MQGEFKDYYAILECRFGATRDELHQAYRRAALKYHPDLNPDESAARRMAEANEAWDVLSDPIRRAQYDADYRIRTGRVSGEAFFGTPQSSYYNQNPRPSGTYVPQQPQRPVEGGPLPTQGMFDFLPSDIRRNFAAEKDELARARHAHSLALWLSIAATFLLAMTGLKGIGGFFQLMMVLSVSILSAEIALRALSMRYITTLLTVFAFLFWMFYMRLEIDDDLKKGLLVFVIVIAFVNICVIRKDPDGYDEGL